MSLLKEEAPTGAREPARVAVFGIGYVGAVTGTCLAHAGHRVIGVDVNNDKISMIQDGISPISEPRMDDLVAGAVEAGHLSATDDVASAVSNTDVSIICVGTPSGAGGSPNYGFIESVCASIGESLRHTDKFHVVAIRSTILPGTSAEIIVPTLERSSGKRAGRDFGFAHIPEFLREGTAVEDYNNPPKTVIGTDDDRTASILKELFSALPGPHFTVPVPVAEMVKFADNSWHALKVAYANEIGTLCKSVGIDSHSVMDVFCADRKLNISTTYLKPGFAFGGSCLPKDTRALGAIARQKNVSVPVLDAILPSNQSHIDRCLEKITSEGRHSIGILGLSFKADTDDLRESPTVEITERLIGKGYDVRIFDPTVEAGRLLGANKRYALERLPHISRIMLPDLDSLLNHADVLVVANSDKRFRQVAGNLREGQKIFDFVRLSELENTGNYDGLCW